MTNESEVWKRFVRLSFFLFCFVLVGLGSIIGVQSHSLKTQRRRKEKLFPVQAGKNHDSFNMLMMLVSESWGLIHKGFFFSPFPWEAFSCHTTKDSRSGGDDVSE